MRHSDTTLLLHPEGDVITVNGKDYELAIYCEITGISQEEIIMALPDERIEYVAEFEPDEPEYLNDFTKTYGEANAVYRKPMPQWLQFAMAILMVCAVAACIYYGYAIIPVGVLTGIVCYGIYLNILEDSK